MLWMLSWQPPTKKISFLCKHQLFTQSRASWYMFPLASYCTSFVAETLLKAERELYLLLNVSVTSLGEYLSRMFIYIVLWFFYHHEYRENLWIIPYTSFLSGMWFKCYPCSWYRSLIQLLLCEMLLRVQPVQWCLDLVLKESNLFYHPF